MKSQAKRGGQGVRIGHLDSLTGILTEMGCVYREMRRGLLPHADGAKLVYALRCMRDVIETMAFERIEERLVKLEDPAGVPRHEGHEGTRLQ
jgi:hypothetical protein